MLRLGPPSCAQMARDGHSLVVLDIPLLYETGLEASVDAVAVVSAPGDIQRQRVLSRPGMTEERFAAILSRQVASDSFRIFSSTQQAESICKWSSLLSKCSLVFSGAR